MQTISRSFAIMTAVLTIFVLFSSVWAAEPQQVNINTAIRAGTLSAQGCRTGLCR